MTKYALFTYTTDNIGDDIQSIAALQYLPRIDYFIDRDRMNEFNDDKNNDEIKLIMNGFYTHRPENFPPKIPNLNPLLTSVHIDRKVQHSFNREDMITYLKDSGPVGARNQDTSDYLTNLGIENYLSACLTLTINPEKQIKKQDFILAIDVPDSVYEKILRTAKQPVIRIENLVCHRFMNPERRLKLAQYYLYLYQSAHLVVTTRLHATLPCLALGTPVLNIELPNFDLPRFKGLRELSNHMTVEEFLNSNMDFNNPDKNPKKHLKLREHLIQQCKEYTGFHDNSGFLHGLSVSELLNDPLLIQSITTGLGAAFKRFGAIH